MTWDDPARWGQVGVIGVRGSEDRLEVCLIRRRGAGDWSIPKGDVDPGHTLEEAALAEAFEEAGLRGELVGGPIGSYVYRKRRAELTVAVYLMKVTHALPAWLEMDDRERSWWPLARALVLLAGHPVRPVLEGLPARLAAFSD